MNTTFALLPAGRSPATYRLAEALSAGALPVFIHQVCYLSESHRGHKEAGRGTARCLPKRTAGVARHSRSASRASRWFLSWLWVLTAARFPSFALKVLSHGCICFLRGSLKSWCHPIGPCPK